MNMRNRAMPGSIIYVSVGLFLICTGLVFGVRDSEAAMFYVFAVSYLGAGWLAFAIGYGRTNQSLSWGRLLIALSALLPSTVWLSWPPISCALIKLVTRGDSPFYVVWASGIVEYMVVFALMLKLVEVLMRYRLGSAVRGLCIVALFAAFEAAKIYAIPLLWRH